MNLARTYALVFGVVYTIVGLGGFTVSSTMASADFIVFPVNIIHNLAHLVVIGLPGIIAYFMHREVAYARAMTVLFAILFIGGFFPQPFLGIVPLGGADLWLHLGSGVLAGIAGWAYGGERTNAGATATA